MLRTVFKECYEQKELKPIQTMDLLLVYIKSRRFCMSVLNMTAHDRLNEMTTTTKYVAQAN